MAALLNSCKKTDEFDQQKSEEARNASLVQLQEALKKNPALGNVIFPINVTEKGYYADSDGNRIDPSNTNSYTYQCVNPVDMDYPPSFTLVSIGREYNCLSGYRFVATWTISVPLGLFGTSPLNPANLSKGRIRIKNILGTTTYSNLAMTPVTVTNLGDDPMTGNINRLYRLVYTTPYIPFSNFTPQTTSIEHSIVAYTDCAILPSVVSPYINTGSYMDATVACNRIDPVAVGNAQAGSNNGSLLGFGNFTFNGSCPTPPGGTYPDRQEVQLRYTAGGNWHNITPTVGTLPGNLYLSGFLNPFTSGTQAGTIGLYDVYYIPNRDLYITTPGVEQHGSYLVRYRNKMYSGCVGQWSAEIPASF